MKCVNKKIKYRSILFLCIDEIKGEKETWISKVENLNKKSENLLGDALISASLICILPPFNKSSRYK